MSKSRLIAGLDIGSSRIRTVVATLDEKSSVPNIIGVGVAPSFGLRKGGVIDVEETINSISSSLEDAERMAGEPINHVFLGIGGTHLASQDSKGVIAISHSGNEIAEDDVDRVLEAAQAVSIPNNRRILRIIPKSFIVDEQKGIKYPVGMTGIRLEVEAHLITGLAPAVKNIEKCVHQAGVDIDDIIPSGLASAEAVLSKRQKELGVVVIDVGCGGTSISVFEEGTTLYTAVIPVGGENVTNDIAIGLRTSIDTAEKIKIEYGSCIPEDINDRETIDLSLLSKIDTQTVSKKQLSEIIQARYHEIFVLVKDHLAKINRDGMLPAGAILTGAGVKTPGTVDLARDTLNLPVQIGFPQNFEGVVDKIDDPAYATAIGLALWGARFEGRSTGYGFDLKGVKFDKLISGVKGWIKGLLP
ncbi:cell division protein FtsA [Candidatus Peregrinibacteria bacterium RIFOXYB12_FULL_41_12]|nr:MAG: cell division protein FtsA [Candidatus Peregrinibacteria bacterium RIFOXYB12_FULL_41_12]OGJ48325.1 MAG: cell division protein FtsA [Candidatus Peregrinibacteria bacterium RIFOXYA2_FULL_41_18]OGJ53320.1 MAG: cell division protein FtsA [Candidatus Peregrinibacteria bacterium RIFOXYC2_FULL_41_22]OGJ54281.1 MAG: cell division protein FtsA [Candidatus Peregrinibacteria bacterium RIFOXYB2_FULL_41_88]